MVFEFKLTDKECKSAEIFEKEHAHKDVNKGTIGGHIEYIFTPNSIARGVSIKCNVCNKERNITDYDVWLD